MSGFSMPLTALYVCGQGRVNDTIQLIHQATRTQVSRYELPLTAFDNKKELLATVAGQLKFPSYFGNNWDALYDCLRDLAWLPPGVHAIVLQAGIVLAADRELVGQLFKCIRDAHYELADDASREGGTRWLCGIVVTSDLAKEGAVLALLKGVGMRPLDFASI